MSEGTQGLKGMMHNISPGMKMAMVASAGITIVFSVIIMRSFGGDAPVASEISANSKVRIHVDSELSKASDAPSLDGTSEGLKLKELKQDEIDTARKKSTSFIEDLEVNNAQIKYEELGNEIAGNRIDNGLHFASENSRAAIQRKNAELEAERKALAAKLGRLEANNREISSQLATQSVQAYQAPLDLERAFMEQELETLRDNSAFSAMNTHLGKLKSHHGKGMLVMSAPDTSDIASPANPAASSGFADASELGSNDQYFSNTARVAAQSRANLDAQRKAALGRIPGASSSSNTTQTESALPSDFASDNEATGPYITAGAMFYSVLEIGVNSDEISPVRATVVEAGPLNGAVLIGTPARQGEKVVLKFSTMSVRGKDYSINVVALDPETMRTALADDVDRHTFERYFKLATAAALAGYAEALTGSTSVSASDGTRTTSNNALPDASDQALYAAGTVGEKLIPIYEKEFDRAPTVTVNGGGRDLGIMFMSGIQL